MRKIFAIITLAATLLSLLCGCGAKAELEPIEKAQAKAVEIGQQYLDFEITAKEAKEMLDSIKVPETEGEGKQKLELDIKTLELFIEDETRLPETDTREAVRLQLEWLARFDYTD